MRAAAFGAAARILAADDVPFSLPKLPYAYDALEPYIDAQTMQIHHDKHHKAYVDNLNKAVGGDPVLSKLSVDELLQELDTLPATVRTQVRNQGGGHANHSLLWPSLAPAAQSGKPSGKFAAALNANFGDQERFEDGLRKAALSVFGSGWAWLTLDHGTGKLAIETTSNQDSPMRDAYWSPVCSLGRALAACCGGNARLSHPARSEPRAVACGTMAEESHSFLDAIRDR